MEALASENRLPTVLVVEDEWLARAAITSVLQEDGWSVFAVSSGEEALDILGGSTAIDLVFTDIHLAGTIDGWEVGLASREAGDTPVVYTSGKTLAHSVEPGHFFAKPYDPAVVAKAFRRLLQ